MSDAKKLYRGPEDLHQKTETSLGDRLKFADIGYSLYNGDKASDQNAASDGQGNAKEEKQNNNSNKDSNSAGSEGSSDVRPRILEEVFYNNPEKGTIHSPLFQRHVPLYGRLKDPVTGEPIPDPTFSRNDS